MAQIIVGALVGGMVMFFIVLLVATVDFANVTFELSLQKIISILAIVFAVGAIIASQVIKLFIYKKTPMDGDAPTESEIEAAHQQYLTEKIISSALLEAPGFFCLMALMIDDNLLPLIGAGACLFFLVLNFPKEDQHLYDIQRRLTDHT